MVSDFTSKQLLFCEEYVKTRNVYKAALNAGYSHSFAKTKAFLLIKEPKIIKKIQELEKAYYQNYFKSSAIKALSILDDILENSKNDTTRLKAIDLILKQAGVINDDIIIETSTQKVEVVFV